MARRRNPRGDEHLRALERGMIAGMEQTGGMCSGLSVTWPQNARGGFAFLVEDEERDGLFHMTTHPIAAEFWNGDATPLHVVSGDATDVVSAIVDAVRS